MKKYLIGIILFLMFVFNGYIGYNVEPVNAAQIPSEGLVAHWNFNEGSGNTVHDLSGNNNDGAIYGAKWVDGISGRALDFDGMDDYVEVPDDDSLDITTEITIDVWIKPGTQIDHANIVDKCHTSTDNTGWVLEYTGEILGHTTPGRVYVWSGNGSSYSHSNTKDIPITTTTLNDNSWHNVVGTYDGTTARIYVDGVEEDSSTSISGDIKITSHNLNIGRWGYIPSRYFNGTIDEVKIYNRALTENEIKTEYDKVKSGLVAHWNFDGVSGNIAPDSAGDNDGTIHGAKVVKGVSGAALSFDGVDDYIEIPNTPELNSFSQLTTSAWVYVNGFDVWEPILNKGGTNDLTTDVFEVNINSEGFVHFVLNFESSGRQGYNSPSNSISAGSWHHVVTLFDGDRAKIYINGILVSDYDAPNEPLKYSNTSLQIGLEYGSPPESYFNGMMDEIYIFSIAISESDIIELYELSFLKDPDNRENKAAEKSPLSLIIDKKYVPVVATATSIALLYLWNIMGNSVYKFIIDFIASHMRGKKSRGKKVKKKKDFSYKLIKNMGIWEIFSIFLAIIIFAITMSWTWSADLAEFIELFFINFFVVSCILGLRESCRLYLSHKNKLKTEYVFWPFGALLTIGSTLLGNTFSLTYYIVFEKEKNVKKFGEMYFFIYLLLYGLSISAFILNFINPSVVLQMIFVFTIMGLFIFMTPVKPMTGYNIKNWNFKKWLIFYIIVSISYLIMNFTIY